MKNKHRLLPLAVGFGCGTLFGFILRNSESTDYNKGYQNNVTTFDEKDYFTDEICEQHQKERATRKAQKNRAKVEVVKNENS